MNDSLDTAAVIEAYRAKFDNWSDRTDGGRFLPSPPLKFAANRGVVRELVEQMQAAIDSGKPMDFNAFAMQYGANSAGTSEAA